MRIEMRELNGILDQISALYHDAAVKYGLSDCEFTILYLLREEGGACNQSVFYKVSGIRRSTVNSSIRKMEMAGSLTLCPGEGRNTRVSLTEKGKKLSARTVEKVIEAENRILDSWSAEEKAIFMDLNRRLLRQMREQIEH